jgi:hypothetical protein
MVLLRLDSPDHSLQKLSFPVVAEGVSLVLLDVAHIKRKGANNMIKTIIRILRGL